MSRRNSTSGSNWHRITVIVGLAIVTTTALLAGALWLYSEHRYRTSYESDYTSDVVLNTNAAGTVEVDVDRRDPPG